MGLRALQGRRAAFAGAAAPVLLLTAATLCLAALAAGGKVEEATARLGRQGVDLGPVRVASTPSGLRFVATRAIERDQVVVRVPAAACMAPEGAANSGLGGMFRVMADGGYDPAQILAFWLMTERFRPDQASPFRDLIATIPTAFPTFPLFCEEAEIGADLQGTALFHLLRQFDAVDQLYHVVSTFSGQRPDILPAATYSLHACKWAVAAVTSRATADGVLVPGLELLRPTGTTTEGFAVRRVVDDGGDAWYEVVAERAVSVYEECVVAFPDVTAAELLVTQGVVHPDRAWHSIRTLFTVLDDHEVAGFGSKEELALTTTVLRKAKCTSQEFRVRPGEPLATNFWRCARLYALAPHEADMLDDHGDFLSDAAYHELVSARSEIGSYRRLARRLEQTLALFGTTVDEDEAWLEAHAAQDGRAVVAKRLMVAVRQSEKRLVQQAVDELKSALKTTQRRGRSANKWKKIST